MFNFMPVLRNRAAFAYSFAYCVHTLEMSALRGWGVAFLAFVAASTSLGTGVLSPTMVVTLLGLLGTLSSVFGNEMAQRFGRQKLVMAAMALSVGVGLLVGYAGTTGYWMAVVLLLLYGLVIWLDSAALTAGTAEAADPTRRGATLAVHSMMGYAGGFVGPLVMGWTLDAAGGESARAWGAAFCAVAGLMAVALVAFAALRPKPTVP